MKREIKFRVWNGQQMENRIMAGFLGTFYVQGIDDKDSASMSQFNTKYLDDTPVMQFTGLKDKKGEDIYEGDIVRLFEPFTKIDHEDQIIWDDANCRFAIRNTYVDFDFLIVDIVEVIGNIYENPELI